MTADMPATLSRLDGEILAALRHRVSETDPVGALAALRRLEEAPLPWVVGRMARYREHVEAVAWSLLVDLPVADAVDAAWRIGTYLGGPGTGDLAVDVHDALRAGALLPWPTDGDVDAGRRLVAAGFAVLVATLETLAAALGEHAAVVLDDLWPQAA